MSATQAEQFLSEVSAVSDLDGDLVEAAAEQGYDVTADELRSALRDRIADDKGFYVDPDAVDKHESPPATCYTWCWECPLPDC